MTPQLRTESILFLLFTVIMMTMNPAPPPAQAASQPVPEHDISVNFDLKNHIVSGVSHIKLPAGQGLELFTGMVTLRAVRLNDEELTEQSGVDRLHIPPQAGPQELTVTFAKEWPAAPDSLNVIDESGISLTDVWHPVADREMTFKLTATIPADFAAVSEADEITVLPTCPEKNCKQVVFHFPHPLFAIHFVAGPYVVEEESFGDHRTLASYFFPEDRDVAAEYRRQARHFLARYEDLIGPYPYNRFAVVENRLPTGFAMPTFTLLGQAVVRLPFIKDTSLGHEILHQWFGNSVGIDRAQGNWAEGLTAYLADHAFAADEGRGRDFRKEQLIKYRSYIPPDNSLTLEKFIGADDESADRNRIRAIGYSKGSMFFHLLKKTLGEEIFLTGLRDFYSRLKYQQAGWSDLLTSFENAAGIRLGALFDQWLTRSDVPILDISGLEVTDSDGRPVVSFDLVQKNSPPYELTVHLVIKTSQGDVHRTITVAAESTPITLPLAATPTELIIDPDYDLLRQLTPAELPPTWSRFEGAAQKLAVVADSDTPDRFAPFIAYLKDMGCRIVAEKDVTDADLSGGALLFLGIDRPTSRSLFSRPAHPETGFTVDIRNNPLNPAAVAILVSAASSGEIDRALAKLQHYGKYSYLHFENGRNLDKRIAETENGLRFSLEELPPGIPIEITQPFADIIEKLLPSRAIYVGEQHTSYQDHQLQLRIIRAVYDHDPRMAIGMEMFSKPSQAALDDYIEHRIDEKTFLKQSHYFDQWSFDYRLYRDIINFARLHRVPIIALNLDRKIVSSLYQNSSTAGLDAADKTWLPEDRDLDVPGYRERLTAVYQHHSPVRDSGEKNDKFSGFLQAQALWDETMAESVAAYLTANPEARMIIIAGQGHTHKSMAIPPRVARRLPIRQTVAVNLDPAGEADPEAADFLFFSPPAELPPLPLLGVMLADTDDKSGVRVADLSPQGQARTAGIRKDDTIIAIDSEPIRDVEDVRIAMVFKEGFDSVRVRVKRKHVLRADEELDFEVGLQPQQSPH
jgi:aminopeptidase N